ncbi:hypothetical protein [Thermus albus]|uniref:hypothetical protein n=1 Tax=Thermus albus TaxID=2908146 RepID=UPI003C12BE9E
MPFRYRDRGQLAVIGRNQAVAQIAGMDLSGFPAWLLWALIHLTELAGFRNRLLVLLDWAYSYFFREPGVRILPQGPVSRIPALMEPLNSPVPPRSGRGEPS